MTGTLNGKVVAITGGARGIGAATAKALAAEGAAVVIGDLDVDLAKKSAEEYDGLALPLDVADRESFAQFLDAVVKEHGRLDVLVNNAGFMVLGKVQDVPLERQLAQVDVNLNGVIHGSYEAAARMRAGGVIVNIASLAGRLPMPGSAVYSAHQGGRAGLQRGRSTTSSRPRASGSAAVLPSFTNTDLIDGTEATGLLKPVQPEDVAAAVAEADPAPQAHHHRAEALQRSAARPGT